MLYSYEIRDKLGNINKGYLEADNHLTVIDHLLQKQYIILNVKKEKTTENSIWQTADKLLDRQKIRSRDLSSFMRQLAAMLGVGIPLIKCFEILAGQSSNQQLKKTAAKIASSLKTGLSLHDSMATHRQIFSPVYLNMIQAGETSGFLPEILLRIADQAEKECQMLEKFKSASVYPAILVFVASLVITFILAFILPSFVQSFTASGTDLPAFTICILNIGIFIKSNIILLVIVSTALVISLIIWKNTTSGRLLIDHIYLKIPIIGNVISKIAAAQLARTLGMLISSGIPLLTAFRLLEGVVSNQVIAAAIGEAREKIKEGQSITRPLNNTGLFEPMFTQMISVGEETGTLDTILHHMADFYEAEVAYAIDSLMSIIEPLLIIIVALVIGGNYRGYLSASF